MRSTLLRQLFSILALLAARQPAAAQGLIIASGDYVIANTGNIVLQNNWVNNGSFTHNGGTLIFAGTSQTLGGTVPSTFNNITIAAGSITTIVTAGQLLYGVLQSNDTLHTNGNLTLLSTAARTAAIDGSGTGEVVGNVTMQRYLPSGFGYKYFSSPFQADTVGNFSGPINLAASFPDFYSYDESQPSSGWINYTSSSGLLNPLAGYAANFGTSSAPLTVSLTGVVSNHTISSTLYNHNQPYTLGFNLVGNPYPSPIDWNAATGWTKTNIDNALYFFSAGTTDQYTGTYSSYINGVSSNDTASNIIAAMQGFFIHVSNGTYPVSGLLSVNNNARNTNPSVIFFGNNGTDGPPPLLRLSAGFADATTVSDPMVIYFKQGATAAFNKELDALKLMNTHTGVPNLYAISTDPVRLSIQALPYPGDVVEMVPLGLTTAQDGWVTFQARDILQMPPSLHIYLSDTQSGINQDLSQDPLYRLYLAKGVYDNRFFLGFGPAEPISPGAVTPPAEPFEAYNAGGSLRIKSDLPPGEKVDFVVFNLLGQALYREEISDNSYHLVDMTSYAAGVYIVRFTGSHTMYSKKIFIGEHP